MHILMQILVKSISYCSHQKEVEKKNFGYFNFGMVVCVIWADLNITETASLGFSQTFL